MVRSLGERVDLEQELAVERDARDRVAAAGELDAADDAGVAGVPTYTARLIAPVSEPSSGTCRADARRRS